MNWLRQMVSGILFLLTVAGIVVFVLYFGALAKALAG